MTPRIFFLNELFTSHKFGLSPVNVFLSFIFYKLVMETKALLLASEPIDFVFQNLLESIKELRGTISSIDDKCYYLEVMYQNQG
jgi:hypothetical protein